MGEKRSRIGRKGLALGLVVLVGLAAPGRPVQAQQRPSSSPEILLAQGSPKKKATKARKGKSDADAPTKAETAKSSAADDSAPNFARDVAPVLVGNCIGCHDPKSNNTRAHVLDLTTYKGLMAGSKTRKIIDPGKPEDSPLILRIRGDEMPRMPPTANVTIGEAAIKRIGDWIEAGAKLDVGKDQGAPIASYAMSPDAIRLAGLAKLNANDRDKRVIDAAMDRWKKIMLDTPPEPLIGTRVIVFHNLPKPRAEALKKLMDAQVTSLRKFLRTEAPHPLDGPFKTSIYVFNDTNNFVELARSLENRELEEGTLATGNLGDPIPYVAAADPLGGREETPGSAKRDKGGKTGMKGFGTIDRNLGAMLTEQLVASALAPTPASRAPRWLRYGLGALYASRIEPRNAYYRQLRENAFQQYQANWGEQAKAVLGDGTDAEKLRAGGFSLIEWLAKTQDDMLPTFVRGMMEGGDKLDAGLTDLWGMKRDDFISAWGAYVAEAYGR